MSKSGLSVNIESMRFPGSNKDLIRNLSFEVPKGHFVSFLGKSGVGKTTLLRIIAGIETRFYGEVLLDGQSIQHPGRKVRMIFQDFRLIPWKTVFENISFAMIKRKAKGRQQNVERWLKIVGLFDKRNAWPKTLSGGEQGRVAFARAFIDTPSVLLLDEPFRGLDLVTKLELQDELVKNLKEQESTVVFVSHSIEDAISLSDQVHLLSRDYMKISNTFTIDKKQLKSNGNTYRSKIFSEIEFIVRSDL